MTLDVLPDGFAVCRLAPDAPVPGWVRGNLVSITRTAAELSVVCADAVVPAGVTAQGGWRALAVRGPLDFSLVGVVASLAGPLAEAGVPVFVISTYDTDYLLVPGAELPRAVAALRETGHAVIP